jgi:hypothetical protein
MDTSSSLSPLTPPGRKKNYEAIEHTMVRDDWLFFFSGGDMGERVIVVLFVASSSS